jgi:hypothetical protein
MSPQRRPISDLIALLSPAIGEEKAKDAVDSAVEMLGLRGDLDREQALVVLEKIAETQGLVGITARFAKTKVHLRW